MTFQPVRNLPASPLTEGSPRPSPAGQGWWSLLPFSTHKVQIGEGLWTADEGVMAEQDIRVATVLDACHGSLAGKRVVDLGYTVMVRQSSVRPGHAGRAHAERQTAAE